MQSTWERAKQVFHEALGRGGNERARYLDGACRDDPELRAQVNALLSAHKEAGGFLSSPTGDPANAAADAAAALASAPPPEGPGSRIGPYKVLQLIGEGGFGVVYMADQEQPIRRRVALKIIKLGMDTKEVIARFEAERQALAMMDHPNIAKVLDAGTTNSGRPYFVMELVKGVPITEYCDDNRLSTRERLELFIPVCKALHHAHEKGVIHRDIKPSNVMVTLHDDTPVPKVIDFGIAKATNQRLTERTLFTAYGHFIGTPAYMSPEQAEMSALEVDRRSDVYSLGVLLYELLTGTTPFDNAELRGAAFLEIMRLIREVDPPTPSNRLSTLGERLHDVARRRHAEPRSLSKLLRGDLDWIVMKSLEKDRRRRYDSAIDLAGDLSRYFNDQPVTARRPSMTYRLGKFAKRRKGAIVAAAGIALAVISGSLIASMGGARSARSASTEPTVRRLWSGADVDPLGAPTRDGRLITFVDWTTGDLAVHDIATGTNRRLTNKGSWAQSLTFALFSAPSPDGRRVAYTWYNERGRWDLRIVSMEGGESRTIYSANADVEFIHLYEWSSDGQQLLALIPRKNRTSELVTISLGNGSVRVVKSLGWRIPSRASFSPDAQFVVYDYPSSPETQQHDLYVSRTDGSAETAIVSHPSNDLVMGWAPDGTRVLFASDRTGSMSVWMAPIDNGQPAGEPQLIRRDFEFATVPIGFTQNGSFVYAATLSPNDVYVARLDNRSGRINGEPARLSSYVVGTNRMGDWSSDGKSILYLSNRRPGPDFMAVNELTIRSLVTGAERTVPTALNSIRLARWGAGQSIVVDARDASGRRGLFRVDPSSGAASLLASGAGNFAGFADAGRAIITWVQNFPEREFAVVRRDIETGAARDLFRLRGTRGNLLRASVSPDGRQVAFILYTDSTEASATLQIVSADGGPAREITRAPAGFGFGHVAWSADGRHLLYNLNRSVTPGATPELLSVKSPVMRIAVSGGTPEPTGLEMVGIDGIMAHPDGERVAITAGERSAEIRVMENFLPLARAPQPGKSR